MHDERMMNLRNLGKSYRQVARAMGLSSSCVHDRITRMKSKKHDP
jgi:ribosomal protein L34E